MRTVPCQTGSPNSSLALVGVMAPRVMLPGPPAFTTFMKAALRWDPAGAVTTTAPLSKASFTLVAGSKPLCARAGRASRLSRRRRRNRIIRTP